MRRHLGRIKKPSEPCPARLQGTAGYSSALRKMKYCALVSTVPSNATKSLMPFTVKLAKTS